MTPQAPIAKPARKGARTKRRILTGALEVLAASGVDGTTHRAVAKAAGVSLSTTTYHFATLEDLLIAAFDLIVTEWNDVLDTALAAFLDQVRASGLTPESPPELRAALRDDLAAMTADYLHALSPERQVRLSAEMRFFYEAGHIAKLQDRLDAYRAGIVEQLRLLPELAGSKTPDLDAAILFDAIQTMQFWAQFRPAEATRDNLFARARRYLGWQLGC